MELSKSDIDAITEAIAFACVYFEGANVPESPSICAKYKDLAVKIRTHTPSISRGEAENLCFALELFIKGSGRDASVHAKLLDRLSAAIPRK